jgi:hypothetical protein
MPDIMVADADRELDGPYARLRNPSMIQSHGTMLALHPATLRVLSASANAGERLGIPHADILGRPLRDIIAGEEALAQIVASAADASPVFDTPLLVTAGGRRFDLIMHAHDGVLFAELEPLAPGAPTRTVQAGTSSSPWRRPVRAPCCSRQVIQRRRYAWMFCTRAARPNMSLLLDRSTFLCAVLAQIGQRP